MAVRDDVLRNLASFFFIFLERKSTVKLFWSTASPLYFS